IEAERLARDRIGSSAGDRVGADLEVPLPFELPHLVALVGLDDARRSILQRRREPTLERVRRPAHVVGGPGARVRRVTGRDLGKEELRRKVHQSANATAIRQRAGSRMRRVRPRGRQSRGQMMTKFLVLYRSSVSAAEQMAAGTPEQAQAGMAAWMA